MSGLLSGRGDNTVMESYDEDGEQMMTFGSAASSSYLETFLDGDRGLNVGKSIAEDIK